MESAKTLILNNKTNPNFKAILNLKNNESCAIKFFNLINQNRNYALGIKQRHGVLKIPLELSSGKGEFVLPKAVNLEENMVCAVVDVSNAFCPEIILSGSLNNSSENTMIEQAFVQSKPKDVSSLYETDEVEQIESLIDKNLEDDANTTYYDSCAGCKYRKAFYEEGDCVCYKETNVANQKQDKNSLANYVVKQTIEENEENATEENEIEKEHIKEEKVNNENKEEGFYFQVREQIDALFTKYLRDDILERIIPNSKWVKVDYDNKNEYYVLGLIYDDNSENILYISYGIPSTDSNNPPDDLKEFAQWLPLDFNNPEKEGYWIVYQDAKDGQTLKIDFV